LFGICQSTAFKFSKKKNGFPVYVNTYSGVLFLVTLGAFFVKAEWNEASSKVKYAWIC